MAIPNKPSYSHGSTGTEPASGKDYANGDALDADNLDHYIYTPFNKIKGIIDFLNTVDSDGDGKVDAADTADSATSAQKLKGNDIDSNGDGVVDKAEDANTLQGSSPSDLDGGGGGFTLSDYDLDTGNAHCLQRFPSLSSTTLEVNKYLLANDSFNSPAGLSIIIYDHTNGTELARYTATDDQSVGASIDISGIDVGIYVDNGESTFGYSSSGSTQAVTASVNAQLK